MFLRILIKQIIKIVPVQIRSIGHDGQHLILTRNVSTKCHSQVPVVSTGNVVKIRAMVVVMRIADHEVHARGIIHLVWIVPTEQVCEHETIIRDQDGTV